MQVLLFKLANAFVNFRSYLGALAADSNDITQEGWYKDALQPIIDLMNAALVPLLVIVGTAGSIYAVVLGVNYARAETTDKREEAKKRLINAVIGLVVMIVLLVIMWIFTEHVDTIVDAIRGTSSNQ